MRVMSFHLMPYADIDMSVKDKYRSVWVVLPNTEFDPVKGHALYNRYLDELELAAELGELIELDAGLDPERPEPCRKAEGVAQQRAPIP